MSAARPVNHRLPVLGPGYRPPETRGECLEGTAITGSFEDRRCGRRQCGAYECRYNLLVTHSADVPGRRHGGVAPPWTLTGANTSAGAPSCALDVADLNPAGLSSAQVARVEGISTRRVEQIIAAWRKKIGAVDLNRLRSALSENMGD